MNQWFKRRSLGCIQMPSVIKCMDASMWLGCIQVSRNICTGCIHRSLHGCNHRLLDVSRDNTWMYPCCLVASKCLRNKCHGCAHRSVYGCNHWLLDVSTFHFSNCFWCYTAFRGTCSNSGRCYICTLKNLELNLGWNVAEASGFQASFPWCFYQLYFVFVICCVRKAHAIDDRLLYTTAWA